MYDASGFGAKPGHPTLPAPDSPWWIHSLPMEQALVLGIGRRSHGLWHRTKTELQEYYDAARSGGAFG